MIVAAHLFLLKEDTVLMMRRFNTGYEDGNFSVPAGHCEENETCTNTMIREAREEIAISINEPDLHFAHVMHRKTNGEYRIDFFFECRTWAGTPVIIEDNKCDKLEWANIASLPTNTIPYIRDALAAFHEGKSYSEVGF